MLTSFRIERAFYRLEKNLHGNDAVRAYYRPMFKKAYNHLAKNVDEFTEVFNENLGVDVSNDLFSRSRILPKKKFSKQFYERNGIKSYQLGLAFDKKEWKLLKKELGLERWVGGAYYGAGSFGGELDSEMDYYLGNLGLILMATSSKGVSFDTLEHECMHSCLEKHSANLPRLQALNNYRDFEFHQITDSIEGTMLNEICAFQDNLRKDPYYVIYTLRGKYVKRKMESVLSTLEDKVLVKRLSAFLKHRISNDLAHAERLVNTLPRYMTNPLFFSMGPSLKEIGRMRTTSAFDDIKQWSEMVQDSKLLEKTKSILKAKNYRGD